jgi:uncharacterized protein (TIGR00266 family)
MNVKIEAKPAFAFLRVELAPGETIIAEADAMSTMSAELDMTAKFNGGLFKGLIKKFLGGESLFVNHFTNNTSKTLSLTLVQATPGDMECKTLNGGSYCLERGAYVASDPGVKLGIRWAGLGSFIAREGLFKLIVSGNGNVYFGAYGGIIEKEIKGEYIIDSGHLVGYETTMKLIPKLSNGIIGSITSGEGFVTKVTGNGKIYLQTRNISSFTAWINRYL